MKKPTFSTIALIVLFALIGLSGHAQNYVPFTPRFDQDLKGDIVLIGNNILGPDNNAFNSNNVYNHNVDMQYIDIDSDPSTFSSSSADLEIPNPNCYQIIYAGLYWGAVTDGNEPINQVKFKGPTGGYHDINGTIVYDANGSATGDSFPYSCYADVTSIVTTMGTDLGTYTIANVSSAQGETSDFNPYNGTGFSAGWSLFVVYEDPTLPGKSITSFDGFSAISSSVNLDVPVTGFRTVPAPAPVRANFAFAALEGDKPIQNDRLVLNGVPLSAADRPANNFFNSSVTRLDATPVNNRVPNSTNTLGFDTGVMVVPNPGNTVIANDATSATVRLESNQDVYFQYFFALAVDIIEPNIVLTKIVEDDLGNNIGGETVGLGQPLNYVIGFQNTGNDNATNFQIRDILPINIVFNYPEDLVLPPGVTVASYDPNTREIVFNIEDYLVEENDPVYEIRIEVMTVETCSQLADSCSNLILNQAFATYNGYYNPDFQITDDPSFSSNTGCLITPQATNFLADLNDCTFTQNETLCGDSLELTAANGYDTYSWSTSPTGTPVIGTTQSITITEPGTYYSFNTAPAPCQSIQQEFTVNLFGEDITNPVIPYADEVVVCPNDGEELPNIFLCGANDFVEIQTNIAGASSIIWEQLDESSCPEVSNPDCANQDGSCVWNEVGTGEDFIANTAGQFRLTINFDGGCYVQFHFNVYQNILNPTVNATDIICDTPGTITVNNVPSGYEYSIDGTNYQTSNTFSVATPGIYTVYIRQVGVNSNPCIFSIPDVQIRERQFTASTNITQPLCFDDKGSIHLAANDADPQYYFSIYENGTLVNTVGPITENNYTFENLNPGTYTVSFETDDGCTYSEDVEIIQPPQLTTTAALTTPLTCADGELTIYPEGGTPPYFYFINSTTDFQTVPEYTVTTPGIYDIMVVDSNNCTATTTLTVEIVPEPDFTVTQTNIACAGNDNGSITINVTNANGNTLEYSIDGGTTFTNSSVFTNLPEGTYQVVVQYSIGTSVCETAPQPITITAAPPLNGTAELSAPYTCTDTGTISVTGVTGGTPPYSYSIDGVNFQTGNTFTGLSAGTYTMTIQDASGCTFIANTIVIDALDPPSDLTFNHTPLSCPSNVSTITITGVTGGTGVIEYQIIAPASAATPYQASNTFSNLPPGTYTFQVQDENNCTYSETYTIDPLPELNLNTVLDSDLDCTATSDAVISGTISGGSTPYTYAVSINGGAYTTIGATGNTFTYNTSNAGTYQFQITDANNCTIESIIHTVEPITPPALSLVTQGEPILCHGNSNASIDITIDTTVGTPPFTINVYNDTTGTNYGTQTSGLPAGDYTITVTDAKSCTATDTITITEPDDINVNYHTIDITCTASGVSQGSIIIDNVTGGTAPYNYFVTGTNGYSNSEFNASGTTSVSFDVVDFGLYEINVVDANGCSVLIQDVLVASPPTDLDIYIEPSVNCATGGEAIVSIGSSLSSSGPFYFSIYQGPISVYPNPAGSWIPEDSPGSESATFTGLTPGVSYTFIVYDASTNCSYYEPATAPIPTNSTLTATAVSESNITCTGSADGNVSFNINSVYGSSVDVHYEIFNSLSQSSTGIFGDDTVPANGTLTVTNLGPLPFGNYYVLIEETSGPNAGCSIVTVPFNITESEFPLNLTVLVDQNANCNPNSGIISAIGHDGTAPYQYQITTTAAAPSETDPAWASTNVFNVDGGDYYVHVIDTYGCIVSSPVTTVPTDPSPIIDAVVNNQCTVNEGEFTIDVSMPTAGMPPYSFSINGGAFQTQTVPFSITNLSSGTHTIEVNDSNGCGNLVTVTIEVPLDLTPELTTEPSCNNDDGEITITGIGGSGNYNYSISPNPASISLTGNVFSGVPSGIYTVTITDVNTLCTAEATISLPEATQPSITTTPTAVTCFGDNSGTFELLVNGYSGAYTYEIFDDMGISVLGPIATNTSTNPENVSGLTAGNFTVTITETEVPFCSATSNVIINSPTQSLTLTVLETSNVTCNNDSGTITATATGGWGNYEYELTGDATVAYSPNGTFTGLSAGNYTVNVRDDSNCIASENITLVEPTPINATFTPSTNMLACFGDQNASITITNVTGGQGSNYTYTLNTILPTPSTSGPQTFNVFDNLGPGTYSITIEDGYSCEMTSADIVIAEPTPVDVNLVTQSTQTCLNDATLTLTATGGTAPYTYSNDITFTNVLGAFNNSTTFAVTPGTYSYYVQDANGCTATISNEITIEPLPILQVNLQAANPTINCTGDNTGSIIASAQGGLGNYIYELQDGAGNTINATQNTPGVFTNLVAGTYMVYVESGDCTETTSTITITEPSTALDATFTVNDVTCYGSNDGMLEINATGGTGTIMYAISPQMDQFFETNVFENLEPGTYDVIVQDELGCYITHNFTINEPAPVMLSIVPNSIFPEVCEGDLDGEFSITISGGSLPYSVSLDSYDGPYSTGGATQTQFDFTGLSGGDHIVFVRDAEGCESEWNITMPESVTINPTVIVDYGCVNNISGNTVTVIVDESIDTSLVDYSLNGGPYQTSNIFTNLPAGQNHYVDVRHNNGCIQSTEFFTIEAYEPLTLTLTEGELNEIIATANGGTGDYQFTFNGDNYGSTNTFTITYSGTHTVTVTDTNGCTAVATINMEFVDVCVPNYFTPNGDGVLDEWGPGCALAYPNLEFSIFDRYGRKVATLRIGEKWDGRYKGNELPTGDYWYVVNLNSSDVDKNIVGHFTLYR
ncbi:T9SS type B sorting domain-containing protein [Mangrovimonas cancribranchiae]|uniref:T9SS type B sorting domain-containing protein n=1 Tax=Mangrovimonas cancribranchiae TaxID=3080055 RepID=A0AAU6P321_9FLAO